MTTQESLQLPVVDLIDFIALMETGDFAEFMVPEAALRFSDFIRSVSLKAETPTDRVTPGVLTFRHGDDEYAAIYEVTAPVENTAFFIHADWKASYEPGYRAWLASVGATFSLDVDADLSVILG